MFKIILDTNNNELIEFSKAANHIIGLEAVGGRLFITNQRVVFKSHAANIHAHELTIDYTTIKKLETFNTLGIAPNGLKITLKSDKIEKFAVWKRSFIIQLIQDKIKL